MGKFKLWGKIAFSFFIAITVITISLKHNGASHLDTQTKNNIRATNDTAAESLDTLTADLSLTKKHIEEVSHDNQLLKQQNTELLDQLHSKTNETTAELTHDVNQLRSQLSTLQKPPQINATTQSNDNGPQPLTTINDLTQVPVDKNEAITKLLNPEHTRVKAADNDNQQEKPKPIPYYTIPPNANAVHSKLMTALVGRIPVKGVVTDPFPFLIVLSDDTLAANGLRVPNLLKMKVGGFTEGDLNLKSVRGWITSVTFIFADGTISTMSSNDFDIGHFSKDNALGYLSDKWGNPFIEGHKWISNASSYLTGSVLLNASQGMANAYAQSQTTNSNNIFGNTSSVTGSPYKYMGGLAGSNAANGALQWWQSREESSFDAVYVPSGEDVAVNFTKEISIDYDPNGRKLTHEVHQNSFISSHLD